MINIMKNVATILLILFLSGCASSPEHLENAKQSEARAKSANELAANIGNRAGTPDNIKDTKKAYQDASSYQKEADDEKKYHGSRLSNFVDFIFDFLTE